MDVSGELQHELLLLIQDLLTNSPTTSSDALALYATITYKLAHFLVNRLPSLEEKALALEQLLVKKVIGCFGK